MDKQKENNQFWGSFLMVATPSKVVGEKSPCNNPHANGKNEGPNPCFDTRIFLTTRVADGQFPFGFSYTYQQGVHFEKRSHPMGMTLLGDPVVETSFRCGFSCLPTTFGAAPSQHS